MQKFQINGRLGNQMFQFAHIYSLICKSEDKDYSISCDNGNFNIDISNIEYKPFKIYYGHEYGHKFLGYNESEQYFDKDIISKVYVISDELHNEFLNKYESFQNTLFISVRRGDFYTYKHLFVCLKSNFYEDLFKKLNNVYDKIFLSSDDYDWCKQNIHISQDIIYLNDISAYNTIMLASLCKDFIISNSTFSWWCAWLGEKNGGRILCPSNHFINGVNDNLNKIYFPNRWERNNINDYYEK